MLPAGPRAPRAVQTAAWITRPGPFLQRARARHGDAFTVRIGHERPWVVVSHPDMVRDVFTGDPTVFHAGEGNVILRPILGRNSVLLLDEQPHLRQRKLLLPPFHGERLARWRETMREVAEREVATWSGEVDVRARMQEVTLEIVTRLVFGAHGTELRDALRHALEVATGPRGMTLMAGLGPQRAERLGIFDRVMRPVDRLLAGEITERRAADDLAERDDVLSMLVAAGGMSDAELRDELLTLLVAGHETTASALGWAAERLARHADAWARLREDDGGAYADAVVKETLRLRPVLPVVVRRVTEDVEVGGVPVPRGHVVAPCIFLLHRREDVYAQPLAFRPERWLGAKPGTYTWIPFGGGVRRCIGASFAELEMRVVLEAMARRVDLRPAGDGRAEATVRRAITLVPARGGRVLVG